MTRVCFFGGIDQDGKVTKSVGEGEYGKGDRRPAAAAGKSGRLIFSNLMCNDTTNSRLGRHEPQERRFLFDRTERRVCARDGVRVQRSCGQVTGTNVWTGPRAGMAERALLLHHLAG